METLNKDIKMRLSVFYKIILLFIFFHGIGQSVLAQEVPQTDSLALAAIYNKMGGTKWTDNTNWLDGSVATWKGITVSEGRVTKLELYSNNLQDSIPIEIGNLTALEKLNLGDNPIMGSIPKEIGLLTKLTNFSLYMCNISGPIPTEIGLLSKLEKLQMNSCNLDGPIPEEFGNLTNLTYLNITKNSLSGNIPTTLGNLANLEKMYLYENQFEGSIPPQIGNLINLSVLHLSENMLSGSIPPELANLSNLTQLDLSKNQLSGSIPSQLGNLSSLLNLSLQENHLGGSIPAELGNLANLTYLGLHKNQLDGAIPRQIGNLVDLTYFYGYDNQLTGTIPVEIWSLKKLQNLYLSENQLSGEITPEIENCENLERLSIGINSFEGAIPEEINKLSKLITLYIPNNRFDVLPTLDSLTALSSLNIRDNKFTFEDIEPNLGIPSSNFSYSPQDSVGAQIDTLLQQGAGLLLSVDVGGSVNNYQWMLNGVTIAGANENTYEISLAGALDTGVYVCKITNTMATDLILFSKDKKVRVEGITAIDHALEIPQSMALNQNYPNPFNPETFISYQLPVATQVTLNIYNVLGQKVNTLVSKKQSTGTYNVNWDASSFSSGMYFYQLETANKTLSRRMLLIK